MSSVERWQEFTIILKAWYYDNRDFMSETQSIQKVCQTFRDAGETAAADSLTGYLVFGQQPPPFSEILMDIDSLFKVNRVSNAFDIVNEMNFRSSSATEAIGKIEKLSKLVWGANVTIKDIFMAQAIKDNIPDGGRIALINALSILDRQLDHVRFIEFKSSNFFSHPK